jgi:spore maturation protein CgeB
MPVTATMANPARPAAPDWTGRKVLLIGSSRAADSMEAHVLDALTVLGVEARYGSTALRIEALGFIGNSILHKAAQTLLREPELLTEARLLRQAEEFAPDLVLVLQGFHLSPKTVAKLRARLGVPIVCWCQDHVGMLGRQYLLGADYDIVFLKDRYMLELFSAMVKGTRFGYLAEACNPRVHRPLELSPEDRRRYGCDVMIFGNLYYYRQAILQQLTQFDLQIRGRTAAYVVNRLERFCVGGEVFLDDKVRAVRAARIALNPLHYGEIDALNCRTFELAGCGAFQLVTDKPVLRRHFEPGVELDVFTSVDDLVDKVRYYLAHPELALEIAQRGQRRAHREHSYEARLGELLSVALASGATRPAAAPAPS